MKVCESKEIIIWVLQAVLITEYFMLKFRDHWNTEMFHFENHLSEFMEFELSSFFDLEWIWKTFCILKIQKNFIYQVSEIAQFKIDW